MVSSGKRRKVGVDRRNASMRGTSCRSEILCTGQDIADRRLLQKQTYPVAGQRWHMTTHTMQAIQVAPQMQSWQPPAGLQWLLGWGAC